MMQPMAPATHDRSSGVWIGALVVLLAVAGAGALILDSGWVRSAGCPSDTSGLAGRWILQRCRGDFPVAPPREIVFEPASAGRRGRMRCGDASRDFELGGLGLLSFAGGGVPPLTGEGQSEVYTMTHLCPPLPEWDHLVFFPDGAPMGQNTSRRLVVYERE